MDANVFSVHAKTVSVDAVAVAVLSELQFFKLRRKNSSEVFSLWTFFHLTQSKKHAKHCCFHFENALDKCD